jgi:FemAB-related protein (PEP-CTERM system-associated)
MEVMNNIRIHTCSEEDRGRWDEFVTRNAECTNYHRWSWKHVFEDVFGWPAIYLIAEEDGVVRGILPLILQKCLLRSYLSSMPHLKGGGIVADGPEAEELLLASAIEVARRSGANYLELRHPTQHELPLVTRQDKVGAVLSVAADSEERLRRLEKKTRNLVRKSLTFGMTAEFGGSELLTEFYDVYRCNMRDLGSPSYSREFFSEILRRFPDETRVCVARSGEQTVAAAFLIGFRGTLEVAWASSYRKFLSLKPNMFLYWNILSFAAEQGYEFLDFGRSGSGSGTYEFKMQWGAVPSNLHWGYWLNRRGSMPSARMNRMQMVSQMWRRLPMAVTNILGPTLVRHIPGV